MTIRNALFLAAATLACEAGESVGMGGTEGGTSGAESGSADESGSESSGASGSGESGSETGASDDGISPDEWQAPGSCVPTDQGMAIDCPPCPWTAGVSWCLQDSTCGCLHYSWIQADDSDPSTWTAIDSGKACPWGDMPSMPDKNGYYQGCAAAVWPYDAEGFAAEYPTETNCADPPEDGVYVLTCDAVREGWVGWRMCVAGNQHGGGGPTVANFPGTEILDSYIEPDWDASACTVELRP